MWGRQLPTLICILCSSEFETFYKFKRGDKQMNTNRKTTVQASKPKVTTSTLMRLAGVSAMLAGLCFIVMGMFHPENVPASITTAT
jgi:hypothetical protein